MIQTGSQLRRDTGSTRPAEATQRFKQTVDSSGRVKEEEEEVTHAGWAADVQQGRTPLAMVVPRLVVFARLLVSRLGVSTQHRPPRFGFSWRCRDITQTWYF